MAQSEVGYEGEVWGWGRVPRVRGFLSRPEYPDAIRWEAEGEGLSRLARGLGRSYGDASLNERGVIILCENLRSFLEFDESQGLLHSQAGATLDDILTTFVPRGWFLGVTPGTKFVTLGGCVAADVHGKNHSHHGSFSRDVVELTLRTADGGTVRANRREHPDLFWATLGGMGLTGIILSVKIRLQRITSALVSQQAIPVAHLDDFFELFKKYNNTEYTVGWLDMTATGKKRGRGIFLLGESLREGPLVPHGKPLGTLTVDCPEWLVNPFTLALFNTLYHARHRFFPGPTGVHYDPYFYPLDIVGGWNRVYGRRGFLQYQFLIPDSPSMAEGFHEIFHWLETRRWVSTLAVIKDFGAAEAPPYPTLSFPRKGVTLALDFPHPGCARVSELKELDRLVIKHGGRVYLAKDGRLEPAEFQAMYPHHGEWIQVRDKWDPHHRFQSNLSRRLALVPMATRGTS